MGVNETDPGGPIAPASPLGRVLGDYPVPPLSPGFADRVLAAAEARPAPLPPLRRAPRLARGWRLGRGLAIGALSFGALASAAAATGMLERFDITVPSAQTVWASLTGAPEPAPAAAAAPAPRPALAAAAGDSMGDAALAPVAIVGAVDTPEELAEAFRRIEAVRERRYAVRSERIDQRIANAIENRRAAGLPLPTPEEEAAFRQRIASQEAKRDAIAADRIAKRREELAQRVESGEALTREDIMRPLREDARTIARVQQLRRMPPEERREALRRMPPAERRALMEAMRQWRAEGKAGSATGAGQGAAPAPAPAPTPEPAPSPEP
jgi:hypothetical protein